MDNSEHKSDGDLDNAQQIDDMNSKTRFPHTNEILRPVGSSKSTIVSTKYVSADISTNVFLKCVSTDVFTDCFSTDISTSITIGVIVLRTSLQNLLLQHLYKGVRVRFNLRVS